MRLLKNCVLTALWWVISALALVAGHLMGEREVAWEAYRGINANVREEYWESRGVR